MISRTKATIRGIVQGIGFRPYIYNLAREKNLCGYILNTSQGVEIEVEGAAAQIDSFFNAVENNPPPLAHIASIEKTTLPPARYREFNIKESVVQSGRNTLIAPDVCVCDACLREMWDPSNRRYRYPFINCTNCGPRYTIIEDVPYDRPFTSMKSFQMCEQCLQEYHDPANRRFHAQPNACPVCGPQVMLFDARRNLISSGDPILHAIELLKKGYILAVKGLGGFHLAVNPENTHAVLQLRERKNREEKPLAIMAASLGRIKTFAHVTPLAEALLTSPQRPIALLPAKTPSGISPAVAPKNKFIGVMLPYTPLHALLLENDLPGLIMTSGNLSEEPIVIENEQAFERLGSIADYFLLHNRDIYLRSDDSVVRITDRKKRIVRRSRGYVPQPIFLHKPYPPILACGAELKNTICLTKGRHAFLSQHVGDLKNLESFNFMKLTVSHLKRILDITPEIIAYDLHPNYLSTQFALEQPCNQKIGVQHHHAHIASCMAEYGIEDPVIGLAFDGTGYGTDGKIWGGEILLVDGVRFERLAHFSYTPMPGGDAAIREPWRMAMSCLFCVFGESCLDLKLPLLQQIETNRLGIILEMIRKGINCPETSSLGRLFDAVSAILGICTRSSYEGQAAIMLEMALNEAADDTPYQYSWEKKEDTYLISPSPIISAVVNDYLAGEAPAKISYRFHQTLIHLFRDLCAQLRQDTGLDRIVLSGGVFQNETLLTGLQQTLEKDGFSVFSQEAVPTNDGGIALGQAMVANAALSAN
ncbi:carbamoyltransferase HypF [candidate division KSB1 bacterium]|nr:carbamoyltransferase HypF [candidate division KSB1 bacterium]